MRLRFAYADPPYPGMAHRYPEKQEVDHVALIRDLQEYDGWALSTGSVNLAEILPLCPEKTRIAAWCKTWCSFKAGNRVAYAWEPVLFKIGRKKPADKHFQRDWLACPAHQAGFFGSKPEEFSMWLFRVLGMEPQDEFVDMFPGSGAVSRAWESYCRQGEIRWGEKLGRTA